MDIENLFIANYREPNCSTLDSITRLPTEEAYALAKILAQKNVSKRNRFCDADFDGYYKKRLRTEEWLYNSFIALGGNPQTRHPLYFVLHESDYLYEWFGKGNINKLLLKDIKSTHISFTFGDSMAKMDTDVRKDPFTKESLFRFIKESKEDVSTYIENIAKQYVYIEVQLWSDIYINKKT